MRQVSLLNKSVLRFTTVMFNVYKLTNFTATLFTWMSLSHQWCHLSQPSRIRQTNSQLCICLLPSEVSLQLKNLPKNIYKNKCRRMNLIHFSRLPVLYFLGSCIKIKINLSFYFHTSLWCLKRCENKNLS